MRIFGNVILIIGILFLLLFALAEFGGGHIGFIPFFVSGFMILMGAQMRRSGKGIVQSNPAAAAEHPAIPAAPVAGQPAAAAAPAKVFTVEMPLTPEIAAVIANKSARTRRMLLYVVVGCLVFFGGLGVVIAAYDDTPGEGRMFLLIFGAIGAITALLIYVISWFTTLRPVNRDLRGTIYLRTAGPVQVVAIGAGGSLRLADRAFLMNGRGGMKQLSVLGWGTVDYSPYGHVILGVWDREGRSVYSLPGYGG
jgi:hypothetical protein